MSNGVQWHSATSEQEQAWGLLFARRNVRFAKKIRRPVLISKGAGTTADFAHAGIKEFEVFEIALVGNPVDPHARIQSFPITLKQLREKLGPQFEPGMPINCDQCLKPCEGMIQPFVKAVGDG
jgi:hypothetical protein